MKLDSRHTRRAGFLEGSVVGGYIVSRLVRRRSVELIYDARARDGRELTIVAAVAPRVGQDDRVRFRRLARLRAESEHPAMLPVHDWGEHAGVRYIVTDPYPRRTLAEALRGDPVAPDAALELLTPVADALDRCHSRGLVHQHLGAESMLLDDERILLDVFGIATIGSDRGWEAFSAAEFRYVSPDAMRGDPIAPATDIYSLTAVLVHLLTGRAPYADIPHPPSNTAWAAALLHLSEPVPRPSGVNPELDSAIDDVVAWGMAKEPADRPLSATALLDAAADALHGVSPRGPKPARDSASPVRAASVVFGGPHKPRRLRRALRLSHVAVVLAAAAVGVGAAALVDPMGDDTPRAVAGDRDARVIAALDERRTGLRSDLAEASHPRDQAAAAAGLADAYRNTAAHAESPALAAAARDAASAYAGLSDSADDGDEAAYADASSAVERAEDRFAEAAAVRANEDARK